MIESPVLRELKAQWTREGEVKGPHDRLGSSLRVAKGSRRRLETDTSRPSMTKLAA